MEPKKSLSPAEYFKNKNPQGGTEQLIVFAKYLEDYKKISEFSPKDINSVARVTKIKKIDGAYFRLAVKQGLINKFKRNKYSLTLSGEDTVIAMPSSAS